MPTVKCRQCKKDFYAKPSRLSSGRGKFCSRRCEMEYNFNNMSTVCPQCGRSFRKKYAAQIFCSRNCGNESRVKSAPEQDSHTENVDWVLYSDLQITAAGESLGLGYEIAF